MKDVSIPISIRTETRTAIMAQAQVSWEDHMGLPCGAIARIEDISLSGACIRLKPQIAVGARLIVKWHKERFSGIAKYCRREGDDYVLGIQRDSSESNGGTTVSSQSAKSEEPPLPSAKIQDVAAPQESKQAEIVMSSPTPETLPPTAKTGDPPQAAKPGEPPQAAKPGEPPQAAPSTLVAQRASPRDDPRVSKPEETDTVRQNALQTQQPSPRQERKGMLNKLLDLGSGRHQQAAPGGNKNGANMAGGSARAGAGPAIQPNGEDSGKGSPGSQTDLLPLEDIYRAAGIMDHRMGYSASTVAGMLTNDHLQGMSIDVKRASVLMALESAGIPVDKVLQDAAQRLEALRAFEAGQQKYLEEFEAKKAQENAQVQAEIERVTAHCLERIKGNLTEVASVKEAFRTWQAMKEKEVQRISEAAAVCVKQPASESPGETSPALQPAGVVPNS